MWLFGLGVCVGVNFGVFLMALCTVARDADEVSMRAVQNLGESPTPPSQCDRPSSSEDSSTTP